MPEYFLDIEYDSIAYNEEEVNFKEFECCIFTNCNFSKCVFLAVTFIDCIFNDCTFSGAKINYVAFRTVIFNRCEIKDVNFAMCDKLIFEIAFTNCILDFSKFYTLKIKEQENKEIYTPESIQKTIDSSYDITNSSFTYKQPDQSTVIATYINEEDVSALVLKFKIDQSKLVFFPAPASNNNTISVGNNGNIINLTDLNNTSTKLSNSNGEGVILNYK